MLDRKAKSFEEREQEYEKAKRRIFKDMNSESIEQFWNNWHSSDGMNMIPTNKNSGGGGGGGGGGAGSKNNTDSGNDDDRPHKTQVNLGHDLISDRFDFLPICVWHFRRMKHAMSKEDQALKKAIASVDMGHSHNRASVVVIR